MNNSNQILQVTKHPAGLWKLSAIYSLFMWAFGTILSSLTLYLIRNMGLSEANAYVAFAAFSALLWTLPLPGGYLAEKLGHKNAAFVGLLFCLMGMTLLCYQSILTMYIGLSFFLVGNGLFTPALWCLVDFIYKKNDLRREAGFTLFYLFFNVGAALGIFVGGYLATLFGMRVEFLSGVLSIGLAWIVFLLTEKKIIFDPSRIANTTGNKFYSLLLLFLLPLSTIPLIIFLLRDVFWNNVLLYSFCLIAVLSIVYLAMIQKTSLAKTKLYGFLFLTLFAVCFWSLYNLEPSLLSVFIEHNVHKQIFGIKIPASSFFAFEGTFIIINGLLLSRLWIYLKRVEIDISLPTKFGFSLLGAGGGYLFLFLVLHHFGMAHIIPMIWVVLSYCFFALGELLIGPLGMSMVGKLSPQGSEGLLMGIWQLFMGLAAVVAGWLANLSPVPKQASLTVSNTLYLHLFFHVGLGAVLCGMLLFLFVPWIKKLTH